MRGFETSLGRVAGFDELRCGFDDSSQAGLRRRIACDRVCIRERAKHSQAAA